MEVSVTPVPITKNTGQTSRNPNASVVQWHGLAVVSPYVLKCLSPRIIVQTLHATSVWPGLMDRWMCQYKPCQHFWHIYSKYTNTLILRVVQKERIHEQQTVTRATIGGGGNKSLEGQRTGLHFTLTGINHRVSWLQAFGTCSVFWSCFLLNSLPYYSNTAFRYRTKTVINVLGRERLMEEKIQVSDCTQGEKNRALLQKDYNLGVGKEGENKYVKFKKLSIIIGLYKFN